MEFIEGKCPKCQGILQIPATREKIICMYCGEELVTADILVKEGQAAAPRVKPQDYDHYINIAMNELPNIVLSVKQPLENFRRDRYQDIFKDHYHTYEEVLKAVENAIVFADDKEQVLDEIANHFVKTIEESMQTITKKRAKEQKLMDYNLCMAVYAIPAILEYKGEASDALADYLLTAWKKQYPTTNLGKSTFEDINNGFRKKLCYITTAVCETLGKGDDCYELTLLREYRDGYLIQQPGGKEIVTEYYDIAPTIVKRINKLPNYKEIYEAVWKRYLQICIRFIEQNDKVECKKVYCQMVRDLQQKYCF